MSSALRRTAQSYFVPRRIQSHALPVYTDYTGAGGSRQLTRISNVQGDPRAFASDVVSQIRRISQLRSAPSVAVVGNKVTISGIWRREIVEWLTAKGF